MTIPSGLKADNDVGREDVLTRCEVAPLPFGQGQAEAFDILLRHRLLPQPGGSARRAPQRVNHRRIEVVHRPRSISRKATRLQTSSAGPCPIDQN
jgi:hypothetical protein